LLLLAFRHLQILETEKQTADDFGQGQNKTDGEHRQENHDGTNGKPQHSQFDFTEKTLNISSHF
jgi:hypothetical protein